MSPNCSITRGVKFSIDDVGGGDQPKEEVAASGLGEVERDPALVQVDRQEQRAPLVPLLGRRRHGDAEAHRVGPLDGLDLDDVGTQGGEVLGAERTGPEGGEVDDADAFEREAGRAATVDRMRHRGHGRSGPKPTASCSPRLWRRLGGPGAVSRVVRNGGRGIGEATPGVRPGTASRATRWGSRVTVAPVGDGCGRDAERGGQLDHLIDRVLHEPGADLGARPRPRRAGGPSGRSSRRAPIEVGATDHGQDVVPLLHGDGGQPDVAVLAPFDAGHHGEGLADANRRGGRRRASGRPRRSRPGTRGIETSTCSPDPGRAGTGPGQPGRRPPRRHRPPIRPAGHRRRPGARPAPPCSRNEPMSACKQELASLLAVARPCLAERRDGHHGQARGWRRRSRPGPSPRSLEVARAAKLSITTSLSRDELERSVPAQRGSSRGRRPRFADRRRGDGRAPRPGRRRAPPSPRPTTDGAGCPAGGSSFTTSAPASASSLAQYAPAMPSERSRTRRPPRASSGPLRRSPMTIGPERSVGEVAVKDLVVVDDVGLLHRVEQRPPVTRATASPW